MKDLSNQTQDQIMKNLQMTSDEIKIIKNGITVHNRLQTLIENNQKIDSIIVYRELKDLSIESITIAKMLNKSNELIDEFLHRTSKIKLEITGQDLINMGVTEGKKIGGVLEKILEMKIKNPKMKKENELAEVKRLL
jgi:hypothetical protein